MMYRLNIRQVFALLWCVTLLGMNFSCTKDYIDPSRALKDDALSSPQALTTIGIGLQRIYSLSRTSNIYNQITANGFVTNELSLRNEGNIPEFQLSTGGSTVDGTNTILAGLWTSSNKIIYDANLVIENAKNLGDKNLASGLIGYATVFKALSIGNLAMNWEQVPESIGKNVSFIDRMDGYKMAIRGIDSALNYIRADSISANFIRDIPENSIHIVNTLHALKARFLLYTDDYDAALLAVDEVNLSAPSVFAYDLTASTNPIYTVATATDNVFRPKDAYLGLPESLYPEAGDQRVNFYLNRNNPGSILIKGFYAGLNSSIPVFLPGEMMLIKAEAYARTARLDLALNELNKVVTKTAGQDIFGVGAALAPLSGSYSEEELLTLIYKNRCIELFMSGLKLEDMRRFDRPQAEMKRNFFPYPFVERDNNPNTPADPTF